MTIGNALKFIKKGLVDDPLRKRLNNASGLPELEQVLSENGLVFSAHEFDEAFNSRLVQCQEEEDASQLREFKLWWDFLLMTVGTANDRPDASGGPS